MIERDLDEAIRQIVDEEVATRDVVVRRIRRVVREGRIDLLARVLRAPPRVHAPVLDAMLGAGEPAARAELHRRTGVGLALTLYDARLLERFARYFDERFADDEENRSRLREQLGEEELYERLLDRPDAPTLDGVRSEEEREQWFVDLLRRAARRKTPPRLLDRLEPLGFDPGFEVWIHALFDALGDAREIRPAVAGWVEEEADTRGWGERLLHALVDWAADANAPEAHLAALLLATPVWRARAQDLALDRLAHGSWVLDGPGRAVLAQLGLSPKVIRALEAYAERAGRVAREEAAAEMAARFGREARQRVERLLPALHRVWAELTLALPDTEASLRHHFLRMQAALDDLMAELGVEPFGEPDEQVPYRLAIHRYIGHDSPPPPEAQVRIIEPGLRQIAEGGKFRIVRKALVC